MKRDGSYRYSLKFPADSEENIRAGEMLEKYGNKKSVFIVQAINEYLDKYPEVMNNSEYKIVSENDMLLVNKYNKLINKLIEEKLTEIINNILESNISSRNPKVLSKNKNKVQELSDNSLMQMLDNINTFL